jgi:hypothetical protein
MVNVDRPGALLVLMEVVAERALARADLAHAQSADRARARRALVDRVLHVELDERVRARLHRRTRLYRLIRPATRGSEEGSGPRVTGSIVTAAQRR